MSTLNFSSGITLDCEFFYFPASPPRIPLYTCVANLLNKSISNGDVTDVFGTHELGKQNKDVHGLLIYNQSMPFFPTNIEAFFPNIKDLSFQFNSIPSVSNRHLIPFPNLEILNLQVNKITTLDGNLLSGLKYLNFVNFLGNEITSLDSNLFLGQDLLEYIDFRSNNIKHVGHDFVLPNTGTIQFWGNPCININAFTPYDIANLRDMLRLNCPPISVVVGDFYN